MKVITRTHSGRTQRLVWSSHPEDEAWWEEPATRDEVRRALASNVCGLCLAPLGDRTTCDCADIELPCG